MRGSNASQVTGLPALTRVATFLAGTFIALNLLLWMSLGTRPAALQRLALVDVEAVFDNAARVAAIRALHATSDDEPPAVVLGLSSAREGIEPLAFERGAGGTMTLLNLAGSGGSFRELAAYSEPFLSDDLATPLVLVGVHASWLTGRTGVQTWPDAADPSREVLDPWLWTLRHRTEIHTHIKALMLDLRRRIASAFDWSPRSLSPRVDNDPWRIRHLYVDSRAPESFWIAQERYWRSLGWFDPASYRPGAKEVAEVHRLFDRLRKRAPHRGLVLLPESATFRSQVPEAAHDLLLEAAMQSDPDLMVFDLRDAVDAAGFRDHAHLNAIGRRQLSERLGRLAKDVRTTGG